MSTSISFRLTPRDFAILETMLVERLYGDDAVLAAIRKKLELSHIVFADDLPEDVATLGSRLVFTIDEGWPQECRLVAAEDYFPGQGHQTIASQRGVAMLGLSAGDSVVVDGPAHLEVLGLHRILYQPEAESRARGTSEPLRLVSSRTEPSDNALHSEMPFDDDPGPSAA